MPNLHTIRLRGPWEMDCFPGENVANVSPDKRRGPSHRITLPADSLGDLPANFQGTVSLRRSFHRPTGLDSGERLILVVNSWPLYDQAFLNGQQLAPVDESQEARFEIAPSIPLRNEVELRFAWPRSSADMSEGKSSSWGDVRLEIHEPTR